MASVGFVLAVATFASVTQAAWFSDPGRPEPASLSPQASNATSGGIRLSLTGAQFTGLDTYVRLEVASADNSIDFSSVRSIAVTRGDATGGLAPRGDGVSGPYANSATPVIMPFAPVNSREPVRLQISALMLSLADGSARRVPGSWELTVTPPTNIGDLLRLEELTPVKNQTTVSGVSISVHRAVRTSADVRITVGFEGASASDVLTPPILTAGAQHYAGTVLSGAEAATATWAFPRGDFGSAVSLQFRSILVRDSANPVAGSTIDGHGVISDLGHSPTVGDSAAIGSARLLAGNGSAPSLIRWTSGSNQAPVTVELVIPSASDPQQLAPPGLMLPSGKIALPLGRVVGFNRDSSGTVIGGTTTYRYGIQQPSDIDGTLILNPGPGVSIVNGAWDFELTSP